MKIVGILSTLVIITSCAPIYVNYDYDNKIDFSKYKTFNYYTDLDTGLSELDTGRLLNYLEVALKERGLKISDSPDFLIDISSLAYEDIHTNTVGIGVGGSGRNIGGGISLGIPIGKYKINKKIIFDFRDESGVGLIWQAVCEASFKMNEPPEQREKHLQDVVRKVILNFPPKQ